MFDKDEENRRKALQVIELMGQLNHQTIVKFVGYFEGKDNLTVVTEFQSNGDLHQVIKDRKLDNTKRQIIFVGVSRALMYLYSNNFIHRDIKPFNILIDDKY